jgi:hypothetical protein
VIGIITEAKKDYSKKGEPMDFLTLKPSRGPAK